MEHDRTVWVAAAEFVKWHGPQAPELAQEWSQALADREAKPPQGEVVRQARIADGAKIDGVDRFELRQAIGRHHAAMTPIMVRPPVEALKLER